MDFGQVWEQFSSQMHRHLTRKLPSQDVDDVLQEVFLALMNHPPPDGVPLPPWLWRLVRNQVADYYRRKNRELTPCEAELVQEETFNVRESEAVVAGWLRGFAECLDPKYRTPLIMADFKGQSMREIAEALHLSVSGAKSRVQRARKMLASDLQKCCAFHFDQEGRVESWRVRLFEKQSQPCCD